MRRVCGMFPSSSPNGDTNLPIKKEKFDVWEVHILAKSLI